MIQGFFEDIRKASEFFLANAKGTVRVISHLDADGITSAALLAKMLSEKGFRYQVSIIPFLDKRRLAEYAREKNSFYIFSDIGSSSIETLACLGEKKMVLVLDHHKPAQQDGSDSREEGSIFHVNPHLNGLEGSRDISASGVVYLFCEGISPKIRSYSHLAIIGAIGDRQEKDGFCGLNKQILDRCLEEKTIIVRQGLRLFGARTKPIHKALEGSVDVYIPEVTGSYRGALNFLEELGIDPRKGSGWKTLDELSEKETETLAQGIIRRRKDRANPKSIIGTIYLVKEGPVEDAREYSTLLNACGRSDKATVGVGACLGVKRMQQEALLALAGYRQNIMDAISWSEKNATSSDGLIVVNSKSVIPSSMTGTIASIISMSRQTQKGTVVAVLARMDDGRTKVSLRIAGGIRQLSLHVLAKEACAKAGGESGGHVNAAGAVIESSSEQLFIDTLEGLAGKEFVE